MPKLGQKLAPPPSDIDIVRTLGAAPQDVETPFDESMDSQFAGGFDKWTSPEARKRGANRVTHTSIPQITLYDYRGEDRSVDHADLDMLCDPGLPPKQRLYVTCPKCVHLENRGIHPYAGPTGCPTHADIKFMTCPICAARGIKKRVYEVEESTQAGTEVEDDPNYLAYDTSANLSREQRLKHRLELHMAAFHPSDAEQVYGIRREPIAEGRSWRIVRG